MIDTEKAAAIGKKPRRKGFATLTEKEEALKESKRRSKQQRALAEAIAEGRPRKAKPKYKTEEERKTAAIEKKRERDKKYKEAKPPKAPWEPAFVGIDGESFVTGELLPDGSPKQAYCLLLRNDKPPIFNPDGLSTFACLNYLCSSPPKKTAFVGYFLNFDFEWILKDLTQDEYKALQHGEEVSIFEDEFRLQWFVGKKLVVYTVLPSARVLKPKERKLQKHFKMITFQDVSGFFQSSFVSALEKWGFAGDDRLNIITSGKAARGGFKIEDLKEVSRYNSMEMELLEELMLKVYESFKHGYEITGLKYRVNSLTWAGPGVFANDFLKQTNFPEEHLPPPADQAAHFSEMNRHSFGNDAALYYPFSLAYFGGRIELAAVGKFPGAFNYDITSAYPYALSLLPSWKPEDFKLYEYVGQALTDGKEFLDRRLMGMYGVHFDFPAGWNWYPFPVRDKMGGSLNVFYPRQGFTNIMGPELFAALDTLPEEALKHITITYAYVLDFTEGYGDALKRMPNGFLCRTAKKTLEMADFRIKCKKASARLGTPEELEGDAILSMADKSLKLILNSLYGKTIQQVGSHKYYNDFVAAWITSTCRALLWRAIAPERASENVLMTMTDGIYSLKPLPFPEARLTEVLGDWEREDFSYFETFKPGIYRYEKKGKMNYKVRGFLTPTIEDKEKLFALIWEAAAAGKVGRFPARMFLTRNLALEGWKREPYLRQFYQDEKDIESELKAKRQPNIETGWLIPEGKKQCFFKPKREHEINDSIGYSLDFENMPEWTEENAEERLLEFDSRVGVEEFY